MDSRVRLPVPSKQHRVREYTGQRKLYAPGIDIQQREGGKGVFSLRGLDRTGHLNGRDYQVFPKTINGGVVFCTKLLIYSCGAAERQAIGLC